MIREEEPLDRIRKAHGLISKAEQSWNAGDLAAVEECIASLEKSAVELRAARAAAMGRIGPLRSCRSEVLRIKETVSRIERVSDFAAAFLRGRTQSDRGCPLYGPDGVEDTPAPTRSTPVGIQA